MKLLSAGSEVPAQLCPLDTATVLSHAHINEDTFAKCLSTQGYKKDTKTAQNMAEENMQPCNPYFSLFCLFLSLSHKAVCLSLCLSSLSLFIVNYRS